MFLNLFRARQTTVVRWHRPSIHFQNIFRYSRSKSPWKPVVMGYYRCESAERELAACSQPYATNRAFCSSCGWDAVGLFPSAGPAVIGNNEIRGSRAFIGKPLRERGIRSISELLSSLSLSLFFLLSCSLLSRLSLKVSRGTPRRTRQTYKILKRTGISKGGRVRDLSARQSSAK